MKLLNTANPSHEKIEISVQGICSIYSASLTDGWINRLIIPLIRKTFNPVRSKAYCFTDVSVTLSMLD